MKRDGGVLIAIHDNIQSSIKKKPTLLNIKPLSFGNEIVRNLFLIIIYDFIRNVFAFMTLQHKTSNIYADMSMTFCKVSIFLALKLAYALQMSVNSFMHKFNYHIYDQVGSGSTCSCKDSVSKAKRFPKISIATFKWFLYFLCFPLVSN